MPVLTGLMLELLALVHPCTCHGPGSTPQSCLLAHCAASRNLTWVQVTLGLHVLRFPEALEDTLQDLLPNRLTEYVYVLADCFTSFYRDCKVSWSCTSEGAVEGCVQHAADSTAVVQVNDSPQQDSRLILCQATATVMKQTLLLLGINPLNRI